jgi:hypothetical protein
MNDFSFSDEFIDHIIAHNEPMPLPKLLAELERLVSAVEAR